MSQNIMKSLKQQFLEYVEIEKGRAIRTVQNYDHYLTVFLTQTKVKKPANITNDMVREFRIWLNRQAAGNNRATGKTMSKKTQNYYMIALRSFLKYLKKIGHETLAADQIELAKIPERTIDVITAGELDRLLKAPEQEKEPEAKYRDQAILELLFSTGLRVSELCALTSDIDLTRDEMSIRGKGGKVRVVFISPDAKEALKKYLKVRRSMSEALFVRVTRGDTVDAAPLNRRSIERIVKKYATLAGITKKVTPHVIRHCFATDLLENGADLRSEQQLLGHANIATTQVYTHVTDKHLREVHQKFHGRKKK